MNRNRKKQKPAPLSDESEDGTGALRRCFLGASLKKRNPIIFARTETVHMPKSLQKAERHKKLANAVYSVHNDGSLKPTHVEEPEEIETKSKKRHCGVSLVDLPQSSFGVVSAAAWERKSRLRPMISRQTI